MTTQTTITESQLSEAKTLVREIRQNVDRVTDQNKLLSACVKRIALGFSGNPKRDALNTLDAVRMIGG